MSNRPPYKRRKFDPERHCGAPMDRNQDSLQELVDKGQREIDSYLEIEKQRPLSLNEKKKLARRIRSVGWRKRALEELRLHGPDDRPCMQPKGRNTDHPDTGLCSLHCTCKGKPGGHLSYYSRKALDRNLQDMIDEMERSGEDVLNLEPDVLLLRAKIKLFVDAMQGFEPETIKSLTILEEQLRRTVDSINDKRFKTSIAFETFQLIMARMGETVAKYVTDEEIRERIILEWQKISVDTAQKRNRAMLAGAIAGGE